jgi:hypothetical protein
MKSSEDEDKIEKTEEKKDRIFSKHHGMYWDEMTDLQKYGY